MAYHKIDEVIQRWIDVTEGRETVFFENNCTPVRGGRLYSYGSHFELGRPLRSRSGKVKAYVLNGDQWSGNRSSTPGQQFLLRNKLEDRTKVIIPFSALNQAGIALDSIRIIDIKPDRSETRKHHATKAPEGSQWRVEDVMGYVPRTEEEIAALRWQHWNAEIREGRETPEYFTRNYVKTGTRSVLHLNWRKWSPEITVTWNEDHTAKSYEWETYHHWLGESLIRARVDWWGADHKTHHRWAYFLSGFDHQEPAPLYFLCELPRGSKPATVADAYEILKPEPVKLAEQMGRTVIRQGDIFAVPAPTLDRRTLEQMGATFEKRGGPWPGRVRGEKAAMLLNTNHVATEVARLPNGLTLARGCLYHDPWGRQKDHVRRKIGDGQGWHIIMKNTVPVGRR